jgi:hypothetical protein
MNYENFEKYVEHLRDHLLEIRKITLEQPTKAKVDEAVFTLDTLKQEGGRSLFKSRPQGATLPAFGFPLEEGGRSTRLEDDRRPKLKAAS